MPRGPKPVSEGHQSKIIDAENLLSARFLSDYGLTNRRFLARGIIRNALFSDGQSSVGDMR
jgi:hypothetical protein